MKLYHMQASGNCYKVRLLLSHLGQACELVDVDITQGESRTTQFLDMNTNGRVPLLQLDESTFLPESNAILYYLADESPLFPADKLDRARVMQWMFFEQYSHEPFIATSRYWIHILGQAEQYASELEQKRAGGYAALAVMEQHLSDHDYFVSGQYTIADIALYAYTHVAEEGGFDLLPYPNIRAWFSRVESQPGYIPITAPLATGQ